MKWVHAEDRIDDVAERKSLDELQRHNDFDEWKSIASECKYVVIAWGDCGSQKEKNRVCPIQKEKNRVCLFDFLQ